MTGQDEKAIQYNILKRDVDSNRQLYDNMLQQLKQSSIASAMHASNVRVVDPAELPILACLSEFQDQLGAWALFRRAVRTDLHHHARACQPHSPAARRNPALDQAAGARNHSQRLGRWRKENRQAIALPALSGANQNGNGSVELVTWERKPSLMAEAFRATLTSILFVGENGSRPRVLLLTSASASDGKTTVVSNLGLAIAEIRRRVLIIDADLRRPRMHDLFNLPNHRGLSDLLREQSLSEASVNGFIQKTEIPNLDVLTSGPATYAAVNLLYSPNLKELIALVKQDYDMVLIDTPPMLQMTDARVAGRLADGVVLVARAGETTRDAIIAAAQQFSEDRTRVLGTILNDWDPKHSPNGYYGYYKGSYYSSYKQRVDAVKA